MHRKIIKRAIRRNNSGKSGSCPVFFRRKKLFFSLGMVRRFMPRDFGPFAPLKAVASPAHLDSAVFSGTGVAFVQVL